MAQRAIARVGRKDPLEKSPGDCPETGPDGWPKLAPLEKADWGGAERSWSANGQVRGGLAMLPAGRGRQPGCFQAQTAQAPFVFGSALLGRLMGVTPLVWDHSIIQLRVHSQVQLLERPSRRTAPVGAEHRYTPGSPVGNSAGCSTRALRRAGFAGTAEAYTRSAAARPPDQGEGVVVQDKHAAASRPLAETLATGVMPVTGSRGGSAHMRQTKLILLCTQVVSSRVHGRPEHWGRVVPNCTGLKGSDALIGQQPWRSIICGTQYLRGSGQREAAADGTMSRAQKGSNNLAKALGALSLAARAEEDSKADALGLGAAKVYREEEQRKAEDQRKRERREAQRLLDQEAVAATAAASQEATQLHEGLQGIKGTQFEIRVQRAGASSATSRQVLTIATGMRSIHQFKELDAQHAITLVFANLAMANTHNSLMLAKLRVGTYCDPHPPLNKPAKIKIEYQGQGEEPTSDMVTKLLQRAGCTSAEMWCLGDNGKCEHPKFPSKSASGMAPIRYFSPAYIGTVQAITQDFIQRVDGEGKVEFLNGTLLVAPLPPTGEFMVPLVMSAGASDALSGNLWAMTVMGLSTNQSSLKYQAQNVLKNDDNEWAVQVDSDGGVHRITLQLAQRARVLAIAINQGTRGRFFTMMNVCEAGGHSTANVVNLPLETSTFGLWLTEANACTSIDLCFSQEHVVGAKGSAGLRHVEVGGYLLESEDGDEGRATKRRQ